MSDVVTSQPHVGVGVGADVVSVMIANFTNRYDEEEGTFVVYEIVTTCGKDNALALPEGPTHVYRRFSNFRYLSQYLNAAHPYVIIPPIPEKKVNFSLEKLAVDVTEEDFLRRRKDAFSLFLNHVMGHPILREDKGVHAFLLDEDWTSKLLYTDVITNEEVLYTGTSWRDSFSNFTISRKGNPPPTEFVNFKNFSTIWFDNIASALKAHENLAISFQDTVDVHEDLKAGYRELAHVEDRLKAPLMSTAKVMGKISEVTDRKLMYEQRDVAEALFNLVLYSGSIKTFLKHEAIANSQKENAKEALTSKQNTLNALVDPENSKGIGSMWTRLTTSKSEEKIESLKQEVEQLELSSEQSQENYNVFVEKALEEIKYFHTVKQKQMMRIFRNFAEIQQKHASAMIKQWSNVKSAVKTTTQTVADDDDIVEE
eukprot:m.91638 g.91638  ORF g.91638 m.91638 type:complete len:427 (+) comp12336_c0_seq1:71-1351(+)